MDKIRRIIEDQYELKLRNIQELAGEVDRNYRVETQSGDWLAAKFSRMDESVIDMQNRAIDFLLSRHTSLHLPRLIVNKQKEPVTRLVDENGQVMRLRLFSWVPGRLWHQVTPQTSALRHSLGQAAAGMCRDLAAFDHPAAHRDYQWDVSQVNWIRAHLPLFHDHQQRGLVEYFLELFAVRGASLLTGLQRTVIFNDWNDHNIFVEDVNGRAAVTGVVDFGDMVCTQTINELAVACCYAVMNQPDPLAAALDVVRGFHAVFSIGEAELAALFTLIAARVLISVTVATVNQRDNPRNAYLQVSQKGAWDLLKKWSAIAPDFAHFSLRQACGYSPHPREQQFKAWLQKNAAVLAPILDENLATAHVLDMSMGSTDLGNFWEFSAVGSFGRRLRRISEDQQTAALIGQYNEARPVYTSDAFRHEGNNGPEWRTVHLGLDIFLPAKTPVHTPLAGRIFHLGVYPADRDWGGLLIVEHPIASDFSFYTLYGHLAPSSLTGWNAGDALTAGQQLAFLGEENENGGWPHHLHFQVLLDHMGIAREFPGVALPGEKETWLGICPDPRPFFSGLPDCLGKSEWNDDIILRQRQERLGYNLGLSYGQPLHVVRGYLQYLYDPLGRRYVDTVNNVAHVGHQHPRVVAAAMRQSAVLNTNTRYLHEQIVRYAQELCATLPPALSVCYFVNSGSEANELALRLARTYTGQKDMAVVDVGYHGNTTGCLDVSAYKFLGKGGTGIPDYVQVVALPDMFRGKFRDAATASQNYAAFVDRAIENIRQKGRKPAGFICESIVSCGGQIVLPPGYLQLAYQSIHQAGGLCIADEVQIGFGRVGKSFWGFELQGVVPDIVTMGKPIGNGHPLGAVVTTPAIARAFANGMEYFNTYGGNPVSCAVGREVLNVIRDEGLQGHALAMGAQLKKGFSELQKEFPIIGDIRGEGLFLGLELVCDTAKRTPATEQTAYLVNRMRELAILMSSDGRDNNVLKIKPPLPFNQKDADFLLSTLRRVFREDTMQIG